MCSAVHFRRNWLSDVQKYSAVGGRGFAPLPYKMLCLCTPLSAPLADPHYIVFPYRQLLNPSLVWYMRNWKFCPSVTHGHYVESFKLTYHQTVFYFLVAPSFCFWQQLLWRIFSGAYVLSVSQGRDKIIYKQRVKYENSWRQWLPIWRDFGRILMAFMRKNVSSYTRNGALRETCMGQLSMMSLYCISRKLQHVVLIITGQEFLHGHTITCNSLHLVRMFEIILAIQREPENDTEAGKCGRPRLSYL